jgi:Sulfotransferase family/Phytanoyl-CoA dioxygenase (PhyH)
MQYPHTVWDEAEMIYSSIPKVANTTIKTALLESFMPDARRRAPHSPDQRYETVSRPTRIARRYPGYLHWAVVRDPFDRFVSFYTDKIQETVGGSGMNNHLRRLGFERGMPFAGAVELACAVPDSRTDAHLRSQTSSLLGPDGRLLPELLLRFEQLEADWALLAHVVAVKTGAHLCRLRHRRMSRREPSDHYYDDASRGRVARRYRGDLEVLGYPTERAGADKIIETNGDDPLWAAVGDRRGFTVLDLADCDPGRAAEVRRRSGHYLAPFSAGPAGQLRTLAALERGRIPDAAFDVLIIPETLLDGASPSGNWLYDRFISTGRTAVIAPRGSASGTNPWEDEMAAAPNTDRASDAAPLRTLKPIVAKLKPMAKELRDFARSTSEKARRAIGDRGRDALRPRRLPALSGPEALRENGFYVVRGFLSPVECAQLARDLKAELGVESTNERTKTDAVNYFATARRLLLDERVANAVRTTLGDKICFLQVSDLQYNHDHVKWHRDSPYRDASGLHRRDWDEPRPYGVVKFIVYLESDNAGMGILPGSHLDQADMKGGRVRKLEEAGDYTVIGSGDPPNRRFSEQERARPLAWRAAAGDALIFDERLYHCGRRVERDQIIRDREGAKFTLSFVFGLDNVHAARLYSYFRYARTDTHYRDLPPDVRAELERQGLVLSGGWGNYFEGAPEELRGVYLRDASKMDELIHEFAGQAAG